jgi:hypothetical protein
VTRSRREAEDEIVTMDDGRTVNQKTGLTTDANDGATDRSQESPNAQAVREGQMSAAQMGDGNIAGTDVQWPPGRIETAGTNVYDVAEVPVPAHLIPDTGSPDTIPETAPDQE